MRTRLQKAGGAGTGRLEGMPVERRRSGGGVRLRSVSSTRGEGGGVFSEAQKQAEH